MTSRLRIMATGMIGHRRSTLSHSDCLLVIEHGQPASLTSSESAAGAAALGIAPRWGPPARALGV